MRSINEIRASVEAATAGPWRTYDRGVGWYITYGPEPTDGWSPRRLPAGDRTDIGLEADAEFIANARTDVPDLLELVECLAADNERLTAERAAVRKATALAIAEQIEAVADMTHLDIGGDKDEAIRVGARVARDYAEKA